MCSAGEGSLFGIKSHGTRHCGSVHQWFWVSLSTCVPKAPRKLLEIVVCSWWFPWETAPRRAGSGFPPKRFLFAMPDMILFWMALCGNKVICLVQRREGIVVTLRAGDKCERRRLCRRNKFMRSTLFFSLSYSVRWRNVWKYKKMQLNPQNWMWISVRHLLIFWVTMYMLLHSWEKLLSNKCLFCIFFLTTL